MTTPTPPASGHDELKFVRREFFKMPNGKAEWIDDIMKRLRTAIENKSRPLQLAPTATPGGMEFEMVFHDWIGRGCKSVYSDKPELSYGDFHSGTCFRGLIKLDSGQKNELKEAMRNGFFPVFRILPTESEGGAGKP